MLYLSTAKSVWHSSSNQSNVWFLKSRISIGSANHVRHFFQLTFVLLSRDVMKLSKLKNSMHHFSSLEDFIWLLWRYWFWLVWRRNCSMLNWRLCHWSLLSRANFFMRFWIFSIILMIVLQLIIFLLKLLVFLLILISNSRSLDYLWIIVLKSIQSHVLTIFLFEKLVAHIQLLYLFIWGCKLFLNFLKTLLCFDELQLALHFHVVRM